MSYAGIHLVASSKIPSLLITMEMLQSSSIFLDSSIFLIDKLPQGV